MKRPVLLYDGDCGFCTRSVELIARYVPTRADLIPYQYADPARLGSSAERASHEVLWIAADGRVSGGSQAVAVLLTDAGGLWTPAGVVLRLPLVRTVAGWAYRLVAANRHRLPGTTPACSRRPETWPRPRRRTN